MADVFSKKKRSEVMSKIRAKNTKPEILVRSYLRKSGHRFGIHSKSLPGKPDIVFKKKMLAIFIHGCFWHGHKNCAIFKYPKSNRVFWRKKIETNRKRDSRVTRALRKLGWKTYVVWECRIKSGKFAASLDKKLMDFDAA
jgi:DNA mismatch endonuclease (patch repair protein)